ncbi:MAG TPA: U32 family peptidase [Candidatus Caccopulliclostridium gallistercoris]|uniref:U32 family peptidase n=1 Tax=Candidatus Caccopulliclostridium gallistercoris TaxID=2840719 RepID=A0A9D1NF50_9FIRM|nr:U32 family peptidase [Candidatus Caccopulliclostridium gallistercoris]
MVELLAPAGTFLKLKTAFKFGADAVYFAGKKFGLRAFAGNFEDDEIEKAVNYAHSLNKKVYITVNILAHEADFDGLKEYIEYLDKIGVDAVIVADVGIIKLIRDVAPNLDIHVSTQANVTNSYSAKFFQDMGVKRIVLARELSIEEIKKIHEVVPDMELEAFVHGAMCISYSGRCLLSNYFTGRDSNRGACVQACRWEYTITEKSRQGQQFPIEEDERGTYILNSKDLCMIKHLKELEEAGICSFKIEGRMKSEYYVACTVNAYRRALNGEDVDISELEKSSHRLFTTGFYFGEKDKECFTSSSPVQTHEFMALVLEDAKDGYVKIEQRNRFKVGDTLEVLSPDENFNKKIKVTEIKNLKGELIDDAKKVQEMLLLKTDLHLKEGDILRAKKL